MRGRPTVYADPLDQKVGVRVPLVAPIDYAYAYQPLNLLRLIFKRASLLIFEDMLRCFLNLEYFYSINSTRNSNGLTHIHYHKYRPYVQSNSYSEFNISFCNMHTHMDRLHVGLYVSKYT